MQSGINHKVINNNKVIKVIKLKFVIEGELNLEDNTWLN